MSLSRMANSLRSSGYQVALPSCDITVAQSPLEMGFDLHSAAADSAIALAEASRDTGRGGQWSAAPWQRHSGPTWLSRYHGRVPIWCQCLTRTWGPASGSRGE